MDKDVLVQYYCVLVDKYILREPVIINTIRCHASTRIINNKKRLQLLNPGGLQPAEGLIALSDAQGNVRWDNLNTHIKYKQYLCCCWIVGTTS
jgi:hypothetical protein